MSKAKGLLLVFLILGVAAGVYLLIRPSNALKPAKDTVIEPVLHGYDAAGNEQWRVEAKEGKMGRDGGTFADVVLTFYDSGKTQLTVSAPTLSLKGDRARLTGGVTGLLADGDRLTTEEVVWERRSGNFSGGEIEIISSDGRVEAEEFSYNPSSGELLLNGGVKAELSDPKQISAVGNTAEYDSGRMILSDDVKITSNNESYRCETAQYESGTVVLSGGVKGEMKDGTLAADEIRVDNNGITASGGVHIVLNFAFFGKAKNGT